MQSKYRAGLFALCLSLLCGQVAAQDKFRIYTENYPPFNMSISGQTFAHKPDDITGLCTDLVKQMLTHTSISFSMKLRDWSAGLSRAMKKPNHGIFCTAKTEERLPYFNWVGPLAEIQWTLFAKPGSSIKLNKLEDAKKYRIGGYKGDVLSDYLIDRGFNVITITNDALNPRKLVLGQIDLWVSDKLSGPYLASETEDIEDLVPALVFNSTPLYLAVNKETNPKTLESLKNAYKLIKSNGEADAITEQYVQ